MVARFFLQIALWESPCSWCKAATSCFLANKDILGVLVSLDFFHEKHMFFLESSRKIALSKKIQVCCECHKCGKTLPIYCRNHSDPLWVEQCVFGCVWSRSAKLKKNQTSRLFFRLFVTEMFSDFQLSWCETFPDTGQISQADVFGAGIDAVKKSG